MRRLPATLTWLGLRGGERLDGRIAILSPHLDDAILSLGAAIAHSRGEITVVTIFAGDPDSTVPAGGWDSRAGFRTEGEAARTRRHEDELACRDVGAQPLWLPFGDHQYPPKGDDAVLAAVEKAVARADTVLVPAFPLIHEDHARVFALVERNGLCGGRLGRYVEQPYAAVRGDRPAGDDWLPLAAGPRDRLTKLRACRRYATQLPLLRHSGPVLRPLFRYEAAKGGESVKWS